MGRKKKDATSLKARQVAIRLTDALYYRVKLEASMADLSVSSYLRGIVEKSVRQ